MTPRTIGIIGVDDATPPATADAAPWLVVGSLEPRKNHAAVLDAFELYAAAAPRPRPLVLAGGPGWDWSTMIALYDSQETYLSQLDALKNYSKGKPNAVRARE